MSSILITRVAELLSRGWNETWIAAVLDISVADVLTIKKTCS